MAYRFVRQSPSSGASGPALPSALAGGRDYYRWRQSQLLTPDTGLSRILGVPAANRNNADDAGFWDRMVAGVIDVVLVAGSARLLEAVTGGWILLLAVVAAPVLLPIVLACVSLLEASSWQGTFGMRVLGIYLQRDDGGAVCFRTAFLRVVSSIVSVSALGCGIWAAAVRQDSRTWHDRWSRTHVVKDPERYWLKGMRRMTKIEIQGSANNVVVQLADYMENVSAVVKATARDACQSEQVKQLITQLAEEVHLLSVGATAAHESEFRKLAKSVKRLGEEVAEADPDRAWYDVSLKGIAEAATAIGNVASPIVEIVKTLRPLLVR